MKRHVHITKLSFAVIVFANATAALAAHRMVEHSCAGRLAAIVAAHPGRLQVRVQRLPRVPRREPFEGGPVAETASGADG
jgi:hypothetical protein